MKRNLFIRVIIVVLVLSITSSTKIFAETTFKIVEGLSDNSLREKMEQSMNEMISVFNISADGEKNKVKLSKDFFTKEAIESIKEIWKSSAMRCPDMNIMGRCLRTSTGYQVRGIPVDMLEADEKETRQELTVDFLPTGEISNVAIAISMHRYNEIMAQKQSEVDYERRQVIVNFIENFRTAYNRKDIDMLNTVFSDKALIITGKVIKVKPNSDIDRMTLANNKVVYIKQSKQEYLRNLTRVFKISKYINVKFDEIEVVQHPKYDDIYGVTLKQYWHTNRYSDEGYLFLMIDFRDENNPQIQVRTWQPHKNAQGKILTNKKDVFHLGSFRIVR